MLSNQLLILFQQNITFSLNSDNLLIHYLEETFGIIMKGHRAAGNWVLSPTA